MFGKSKQEPHRASIMPMPFAAFRIDNHPYRSYFIEEALDSNDTVRAFVDEFTILGTSVRFSYGDKHIRQAGHYLTSFVSELSMRAPGFQPDEETARIIEAHFHTRYDENVIEDETTPADLAQELADAFEGKFKDDDDFANRMLSRQLDEISGLGYNAATLVGNNVNKDALRDYLREHYASYNGYYFKREVLAHD